MDPARCVREYVTLGLACDRLLPGVVDCYVGPPALLRSAADETAPTPTALLARARWLRGELTRSGLGPRRCAVLDGQLAALSCAVRRSAGAVVGYREEVLAYFDTEIAPGEPDRYRAAHAELAEVLPGPGPLAARLAGYRASTRLAPGLLGPAAERLAGALRSSARHAFDLPPDEAAYLEVVSDRPWSALHHYLGGHRSRVRLNRDIEPGLLQLARLVAHEVYPGHHVEHVRAERAHRDPPRPDPAAAEDAGAGLEGALFLLNTPQSLISEGLADVGLEVLAGPAHAEWLPAAMDGLGPAVDPAAIELAQRMERAMEPLLPVRQDAALLLHDRGRPEDEALEHLCRWLLVDEHRARQMLRFIAHPGWRAYTTTYVAGRELARAWLAARSSGQPMTQRYLELRERPRAPSALRAELSAELRGYQCTSPSG